MRLRASIVIAVGTLALVVAAEALADPPAQISPADDAAFTAGVGQISFSASTPSPPLDHLDFYVSRDSGTDGNGVLTNWFDHFRGYPNSVDPTLFEGPPDQDAGWPNKPGKYWWQAVYYDCLQTLDCWNESLPAPRSLTITPLPAAAVTSATQVETFLDHHPRHRTRKRRVEFHFSSNVAGASFKCLFAKGWAQCKSPQTFRNLEPGRYQFKTRAVVNGLEDPTPVSWVYRILRRAPDQNPN